MKDNNNLIVYCEFEDGNISDVSLELLTKGRSLALTVYINLKTKSCILTHRCHMPRH